MYVRETVKHKDRQTMKAFYKDQFHKKNHFLFSYTLHS